MTSVSQQDRRGKLHTPMAEDRMVLLKFDGTEALNALYEFQVEAMVADPDTDLDQLLGGVCTVEITTIEGSSRYFSGLVSEVRALGIVEGGMGYLLTLRPKLWLLSQTRNQRIFREMTAQDIITKVLGDHGIQAELDATSGDVLEYVVQHGESDLDFLCRLMERFGFNYYHRFGKNQHNLKISGTGFEGKSSDIVREVSVIEGQHRNPEEHFTDWTYNRRITTGVVKVKDYNFETSNADLKGEQKGDAKYSFNRLESFEYPGDYKAADDAAKVAKLRLGEKAAADHRHFARGDVLTAEIAMGVKTTVIEDKAVKNKTFVLLAAHHHYDAEGYRTGSGGGESDAYTGSYEFLPNTVKVIPARKTKLSVIQGPQVAKVIQDPRGQPSESSQIDVDKYGRICVQFPWDLDGSGSMRCRVVTPWAGSGWGNIQIPRIGMEVLVQFLMGDPDHPVVVGCLYNDKHMPPYSLPGELATAGIKSQTLEGDGYNELVMIDTAGEELIRMHAQYDLETKVENDERWTVEKNQTITVKENRTQTVKQDKTTKVDKTYDITADVKYELTVGQCKLTMDGSEIKLSIGGSSITMNATEVKIQALNVETQGSAAAKVKAGMVEVQGGLVKIN